MVELLLANRADVNAKDNSGVTALNMATYRNYREIADILLAHNAEYTIQDMIMLGRHEKVMALLKGNPRLISSRSVLGLTPLHYAVNAGDVDIVKLLLASGADVNARDKCLDTPLHYASVRRNKAVAELLLSNNAEANAKDEEGLTPLHCAIERAHPEVAELLRQHGGRE